MSEAYEKSTGLTVLDNHRRQQILAGLWEGSVTTTDDLLLRGSTPSEIESELRETHLPMLAEAGYIEWDPETGTISKGPRFDELDGLLEPELVQDP